MNFPYNLEPFIDLIDDNVNNNLACTKMNENLTNNQILLVNNIDELKRKNNNLLLTIQKLQHNIVSQSDKDICDKQVQSLLKDIKKFKIDNNNLLSNNQDLNNTIENLKTKYVKK
jgi:FtsZ-binding cell division protein ZapB